jgi:hypothetical protein
LFFFCIFFSISLISALIFLSIFCFGV